MDILKIITSIEPTEPLYVRIWYIQHKWYVLLYVCCGARHKSHLTKTKSQKSYMLNKYFT